MNGYWWNRFVTGSGDFIPEPVREWILLATELLGSLFLKLRLISLAFANMIDI